LPSSLAASKAGFFRILTRSNPKKTCFCPCFLAPCFERESGVGGKKPAYLARDKQAFSSQKPAYRFLAVFFLF
jgi:hypothetical protein